MLAAMALFALVHGSMHGGWCWRDLVPELERRGHRAVAPDLPCDDVDAGLAEYADAVERSLAAAADTVSTVSAAATADGVSRARRAQRGDESLVLVGHSLGSRTIPVVAARRPGARMIFLCSVPTGTGAVDAQAFAGMVTAEYAAARFEERSDGARRMDPEAARRVFFGACEPADADFAVARLRWQGSRPLGEPSPLAAWPDSPLDVVLARDDRAVDFDWARAEAARWLGGRAPRMLPGDHSPFLSCPALLADALVACLGEARG